MFEHATGRETRIQQESRFGGHRLIAKAPGKCSNETLLMVLLNAAVRARLGVLFQEA